MIFRTEQIRTGALMETGERTIFHVDVNSAFLSWSALKQLRENPGSVDLRTIPSAVGGDVETRHGIITAKSIPAKKYGVQTGEPVVKALQKCPQLVMVRSDFTTYRKYSAQFISILKEYTDQVQQVSIDEAFLDVTDLEADWKDAFPMGLAKSIKDTVRDRLGFTVNVGISNNKFLAKMASDFEKPDRIHTLYPREIQEKMWPLPIRELFGCGQATARKLSEMGFATIGEVAACDPAWLRNLLGEKQGNYLHDRANGTDNSVVETERAEAKSYSNEMTTAEDISDRNFEEKGIPILRHLCEKVSARLKRDGVYGETISVIVKTGQFRRHTRQITINRPTNDQEMIFQTAEGLIRSLLFGEDGLFRKGEVLRLIGAGVSNLENAGIHQMGLDEWLQVNEGRAKKKGKLDDMMKKIRDRYGEDAVRKGNGGMKTGH